MPFARQLQTFPHNLSHVDIGRIDDMPGCTRLARQQNLVDGRLKAGSIGQHDIDELALLRRCDVSPAQGLQVETDRSKRCPLAHG